MSNLCCSLSKNYIAILLWLIVSSASGVTLTEIRTDQPDYPDNEEYVELRGDPGESLDGIWFLYIGDHSGEGSYKGSGVVELALNLTGYSIPDDGHFLMVGPLFDAESFGLTIDDLDYFFEGFGSALENSDNVTAMLVSNFTGNGGNQIFGIDDQLGDAAVDIDDNDDGIPNAILPWDSVIDAIGLVESPPPEYNYGATFGFTDIGPVDDAFVPSHAYRASDTGNWYCGTYTLFGEAPDGGIIGLLPDAMDTPGRTNPIGPPPTFEPVVELITPIFGSPGDVISVSGTNLDITTSVMINGVEAEFNVQGSGLDVIIPALAVTGPLTVTNPDGSYESLSNIVIADIENAILAEGFEAGLRNFTTYSVASTANWEPDSWDDAFFMIMNGYGADVASDDWLISPEIDLSETSTASLIMGHARSFTGPSVEVKISSEYSGAGNPMNSTWNELEVQLSNGSSTEVVDSGIVDLTAYCGETVYVAFRYTSDGSGPGDGAVDSIHYVLVLADPPLFEISVSNSDEGIVEIDPLLEEYPAGTEVTITAIPNTGYLFSAWGGDLSGASNPATLTVNGNLAVEAIFAEELFDITLGDSDFGSTSSSRNLKNLPAETQVILEFTPIRGYIFTGWAGDIESDDNPLTITVTGDISIFPIVEELPRYTMNRIEATGYSLSVEPDMDYYFQGESIIVGIEVDTGHEFVCWNDQFSSESTEFEFTFPETTESTEIEISAQVVLMEFEVAVTDSEFGGTIASRELADIPYGTEITLEFTATRGFEFSGWDGSIESSDNPLTILITEDISLTPLAIELPRFTTEIPEGEGYLVTITPEEDFYLSGESVEATVSIETGFELVGWLEPTQATDETILFTFPEIEESQVVNFVPNVAAQVFDVKVIDPEYGATIASEDLQNVPYGTEISFHFTPVRGYAFEDWDGSLESTENPLTVSVTDDIILVPSVSELPKHLVNLLDGDGYSVMVQPVEDHYFEGESISVSIEVSEGYEFSGWDSPFESEGETFEYLFPESEVPLEVTISPFVDLLLFDVELVESDYGTTEASTELNDIPYGTELELEFTPNRGYAFTRWAGGSDSLDNPVLITVLEDLTISPKTRELPRHFISVINGAGYSVIVDPEMEFYLPGEMAIFNVDLSNGFLFEGWHLPEESNNQPLTYTFPEIDVSSVTIFWPNVAKPPVTSPWEEFEEHDGWLFGWFGWIQELSPDYIYHLNLGTIYCTGDSDASLWFYLYSQELNWVWAGKAFYPYMYSADRGWLLHLEETNWFYDLQSKVWFEITP